MPPAIGCLSAPVDVSNRTALEVASVSDGDAARKRSYRRRSAVRLTLLAAARAGALDVLRSPLDGRQPRSICSLLAGNRAELGLVALWRERGTTKALPLEAW